MTFGPHGTIAEVLDLTPKRSCDYSSRGENAVFRSIIMKRRLKPYDTREAWDIVDKGITEEERER